jgi:hypothetical protein
MRKSVKRGHGLTVPRFEGLMTKLKKKKKTKPFRVQMQLNDIFMEYVCRRPRAGVIYRGKNSQNRIS